MIDRDCSIEWKSWNLPLLVMFAVILVVVTAIRYAVPLRDSDIWFHLLYAKYYLANNTLIPDHTIYSWTPASNDTIYCTWLSDLILYFFYTIGKVKALLAFRYFLIFFYVTGVLFYARKVKLLTHPLVWLLCLLGVLMSSTGIWAKSEGFSYLFMTAIVWNWWSIKLKGDEAWQQCYVFPVIMFLWINSHGAVIFGYTFLFLVGIGELLNQHFKQSSLPQKAKRHLYYSLAFSGLVIFCNPYGAAYPLALIKQTIPTTENMEALTRILAYQSPFSEASLTPQLGFGAPANTLLIVLLFLAIPLIRKGLLDASFFLTNLVFAFLYTKYYRTTFYWAPVAVFSMVFLLYQSQSITFYQKKLAKRLICIVISCCFLWLSIYSLYDSFYRPNINTYFGLDEGDFSPYDSAEFIAENLPNRTIGNTYNVGSYLAWRLWPKNKIMIDARDFPFSAWSKSLFDFEFNPRKYRAFLLDYPADIWCVGYNSVAMYTWFYLSPEWKLVYCGRSASVWIKSDVQIGPMTLSQKQEVIAKMKQPFTLYLMYRFALDTHQFNVTDIILARMKETRYSPETRGVIQASELIKKAYLNFEKREYEKVVEILINPAVRMFFINELMLSKSLTYLGINSWFEGDANDAYRRFIRAYKIAPTFSSTYNVGVVGAYFDRMGYRLDDELLKGNNNFWQDALEDFQKKSKENLKNAAVLQDNVRKYLSGEKQDKPILLRPLPM